MIAINPAWQPSISEGEAGLAFDPIQAAQGEDELEQAFAAGKLVVRCWEPGCPGAGTGGRGSDPPPPSRWPKSPNPPTFSSWSADPPPHPVPSRGVAASRV